MKTWTSVLAGATLCVAALAVLPAQAQSASSRAEDAMDQILFDFDASDYVSYRVVNFGYLEITFPSNTPRDVARRILDAARHSPDISGIRENFGGAACSRF
ncbi:hypothetical protein [Thiomonas bhubaneswarensis]|uniref:Uncharacterized protein n=1 Tax=Thiomonas bhubaneswarensis TaxID=339866 RepID=A0A0K6HV44_9BURK|nr:hypothetical protein [Thiomonas bhubaneswarensis]CUA94633.1 hypothetical protein Ga0061069_102160 [Thiomonas bhubaneswarensis]